MIEAIFNGSRSKPGDHQSLSITIVAECGKAKHTYEEHVQFPRQLFEAHQARSIPPEEHGSGRIHR